MREPWHHTLMATELPLDNIGPARPIRPTQLIKKECGVWVCQAGRARAPIVGMIDRQRNSRLSELAAVGRDRTAKGKR